MKKNNSYLTIVCSIIISILFIYSENASAQMSLYFSDAVSGYPLSYTFASTDIMHFSAGKNTNTSSTCSGSTAEVRPNRIQDNVFILQLVSTSLDSIVIFGKSSSTADRTINKIEVSDSKDGIYSDITSTSRIVNAMRYGNCGNMNAGNLKIPQGKFVKFTITLPDGVTLAPTNISEFLIFPINGHTALGPEIRMNRNIKYKKFYSLMGEEVDENTLGFVIEKITYEDGFVKSYKTYKTN